MKKLLRRRKNRTEDQQQSSRITNETVAEHRERILAGGRRFKYPVQYARHRLVINTIAISLVAFIAVVGVVWWQLYLAQNSSTLFYRITRVLPIPVATVDGQNVPYSDYLVGYRSHAHYLEFKEGVNLGSKESKAQVDYIKREALNDAIADAYAAKIAQERKVSISDKQVDAAIERQRRSRDGVASVETYNAIILDHFDWTPEEARGVTARKLLRQEVSYLIDTAAHDKQKKLAELVKTQTDFDSLAVQLGGTGKAKVTAGVTPLVPRNNQDGGLAAAAANLQKGQVSEVFRSTNGDGYYAVRLLESDSKGQVSYAFIKIPLVAFEDQLAKIKAGGKVSEYISVPVVKTNL